MPRKYATAAKWQFIVELFCIAFILLPHTHASNALIFYCHLGSRGRA